MTSKAAIIRAIQEVADAVGNNNYQISLGTPGTSIENSIGEMTPTGAAWKPEPKSFPIVMGGIARCSGVARQMSSSGDLSETDHRIELSSNNVTVALPPAEEKFIGSYLVKALGTTGGGVSGDIDGATQTIPVVNWDFFMVYCNGSAWLTG